MLLGMLLVAPVEVPDESVFTVFILTLRKNVFHRIAGLRVPSFHSASAPHVRRRGPSAHDCLEALPSGGHLLAVEAQSEAMLSNPLLRTAILDECPRSLRSRIHAR